jgi:uncharacterized membrane protein YqhA
MLSRLIAGSRYLILFAVVAIFVAAVLLLVYGSVQTVQMIFETISGGSVSSKSAKALILTIIELVDLFLLATVLYVIAAGLYELFIDKAIPLPIWLEISDLDDLKDKLIKVVIVVLGVLFLGQVISWDGTRDLLGFGAAVALVIAALTYFLSQKARKDKPANYERPEQSG